MCFYPRRGVLVRVFALRPPQGPVGTGVQQVVLLLKAEPRVLVARDEQKPLGASQSRKLYPKTFGFLLVSQVTTKQQGGYVEKLTSEKPRELQQMFQGDTQSLSDFLRGDIQRAVNKNNSMNGHGWWFGGSEDPHAF